MILEEGGFLVVPIVTIVIPVRASVFDVMLYWRVVVVGGDVELEEFDVFVGLVVFVGFEEFEGFEGVEVFEDVEEVVFVVGGGVVVIGVEVELEVLVGGIGKRGI